MYNEALAEFEKEGSTGLLDIGRAYAMAGRKAEAQKVLGQLNALSKEKYIPPKNVAAIYAALWEKGKGIRVAGEILPGPLFRHGSQHEIVPRLRSPALGPTLPRSSPPDEFASPKRGARQLL